MLVKSEASCLSIEVLQRAQKKVEKKAKKVKASYDSESDEEEGSSEEEAPEIGGASHAYAGYADGTLRKWELATGNCTLHIEKQSKKQIQKCLIWKLVYFKGYLISGDSTGEVCIWDEAFGTLFKKFGQL